MIGIINNKPDNITISLIDRATRTITTVIMVLFLSLFLLMITVYIIGFFGGPMPESLTNFFVDSTLGLILIAFVGITSLSFIIMMGIFWMVDNKWKDLRYKMAFYMYHSKVRKNDTIPLQYLAQVGVCTMGEITQTLESMIGRGELKGIVDRDEGTYTHKGLTRKGMRFLVALPPAGVTGLQQVKQFALKEHKMQDEVGFDDLDELEEVDIEEIPPDHSVLKDRNKNKVECPHCGRMNIKEHQFCTFCGEVV